jgi:GxxExxY protein
MYEHEALTKRILACAITVHRALGPGLLERSYERAFAIELLDQGLRFRQQVDVPVDYKGHRIGAYRPDFLIENEVIVEIKAVDRFDPVHEAQLLAYMRAMRKRVGLLLNFNTPALRLGIRRRIL